jgi:hypothetical protein
VQPHKEDKPLTLRRRHFPGSATLIAISERDRAAADSSGSRVLRADKVIE